ncbi:hypothetical protein FA95DRAFT_1610506 [Auriscalpium vulgare]|uniref:Uncharacterized protein n=1 Tax=Auriscalpium vulgare TaxID=40419 RepID=A0ACB8RDC5_9AGAM|nr:hypothetical protein FA95DRAFT_1610506 [Auriscalpium vulgare]
MLSLADLFTVTRHKSEDRERQDAQFEEEWLRSRETGDIDASVSGDAASRVEDDQATESGCSYGDFDIPEALHDALVITEHPRDQFMPVVSYDFDLASVTEFAGARELYEETLELRHIRAESEQRKLATLRRLDGEREATERVVIEEARQREERERLQEEVSSSSSTCAPPSSPIISSVAATSQPRLPLRSLSMREKAQVFARTLFSCICQGNHSNEAEAN